MSSPVGRTALSELANRRTSPSSAQIATEVTGPTPNWVARSARPPGRPRATNARRDAELGGAQRPAAGLGARQHGELAAQRVQLAGEPVDLAQPGFDRLPPGRGQVHAGDRGAARGGPPLVSRPEPPPA